MNRAERRRARPPEGSGKPPSCPSIGWAVTVRLRRSLPLVVVSVRIRVAGALPDGVEAAVVGRLSLPHADAVQRVALADVVSAEVAGAPAVVRMLTHLMGGRP